MTALIVLVLCRRDLRERCNRVRLRSCNNRKRWRRASAVFAGKPRRQPADQTMFFSEGHQSTKAESMACAASQRTAADCITCTICRSKPHRALDGRYRQGEIDVGR